MPLHPYEPEDAYGANSLENSTVQSGPINRIRWGTHKPSPAQGRKKRASIMRRWSKHKRAQSDQSEQSDGSDGLDSVGTGGAGATRTIYFNQPLPPEAKDEDGRPLMQYKRNKTRTAKYTPLSFIPKNLWLQFHNIANIYFLFIICLSAGEIFGGKNPGLNAAPLLVILFVTAVKDAIEDTRRTLLDNELNNSPVHRLIDWENVNVSADRVGPWRMFKKANTRAVTFIWSLFKKLFSKKKGQKTATDAYLEAALDRERSENSRRASALTERSSFGSTRDDEVELTPLGSPKKSYDQDKRGFERPSSYSPGNQLAVPGQGASQHTKRDWGDLIDHSKPTAGKAVFRKQCWKNVQVGDFVRLYNDEEIPADIVVLSTSDPDGACYIETKNLDGETNLKVRQSLHSGQKIKRAQDCERTEFRIESEPPQANLYSYSGVARWNQKNRKHPEATPNAMAEPISINNLLLRGCSIRNTTWVLGVVVFTGQETKIMLNSGITPSKRAFISRDLNWNVIYNFFILFGMCFVAALVEGASWARTGTSRQWFEYSGYGNTPALNGFITFWAAVILFQNLIPISLYISLEIVRLFQAFFIFSDHFMYYDRLDYPCTPKSWNISDDLGQIEYIFSDKTGTLTQNVMEFKKATIGGVPYGEAYTEALAGMQKRQGIDTETEGAKARDQIARDKLRMLADLRSIHDNPYLRDEQLTFVAPDFVTDLRGEAGGMQVQANRHFMLALALCHTVITERTPGNPPRIEFRAQSPDEAALVATARDCGFTVIGRTQEGIIVNIMGEEQEYTILNTLEFNSSRKRMSAIMRMPDGKIMLYCKGADSVIYSRLKPGEQAELRKNTAEHLEMFAREGLRTLCIAQREIPPEVYREWNQEHDLAAAAVENREEKLEVVSDAIERDLTLLGGTAIEDRLQDGVPDAIALLGDAGIKLWVLTGDKVETAINIGFSCNLLGNDMDLIIFKIDDGGVDSAEKELDKHLQTFNMTGSDAELKAAKKSHEPPAATHAIVIDGDSLKLVLDERLQRKFLLLCKQCKAVLCCRVSPSQKAAVVRMVKTGLGVMTLSIGDGANDVAMIQEADVGVGIAGEEGRQAVMSSDFAIGQFRFLCRLTLVHGRWCYRRMGETISNFFYKTIVWVFTLFWFQIYDDFDCQEAFDYTYIILVNLAFSSLTVIFMGILDQDVNDKVSLAVPQLYRRGIERKEWTQLKFWLYMLDGLYQSVIVYFMGYLLFSAATFNTESGQTINDLQRSGVYIANSAILVINLYLLMNMYRWDYGTIGVAILSLLFIFGWTGIYTSFTVSFQFYQAGNQVYGQLSFWVQNLLVIVIALLPRFVIKSYQKMYMPRDIDVVREQVRQGKFDYLDRLDPDSPAILSGGKHVPSESSSEGSDLKANGTPARQMSQMSDDKRPMYPPSTAPTVASATRNPHSTQNSDDSTPMPVSANQLSFDQPRVPLERPRPSFDRVRSSMDQLRPSFEASEMTSASQLARVESSTHSTPGQSTPPLSREASRLRDQSRGREPSRLRQQAR